MRPADAPAAVQLDFDLRQMQLDGPTVQPPAAEDHGQLVHALEQ